MPIGKYTVVYDLGGNARKLCKIWFGPDGSYYVTSPYHPANRALLMKATVNYDSIETEISESEALDLASAEDDQKRIKFSHHADGFIQFSGQGILSGIDEQGNIRGIGIRSWPLAHPVSGPAFGIMMRGVEQFQLADKISDEICLFSDQEFLPISGAKVILEGYYFPALWRRFVRLRHDGSYGIDIFHPNGAVLPLKVLFPPERCLLQGFLGLEIYTEVSDDDTPTPSFFLSGSTGNLRRNQKGELLGDGIYCFYPHGAWQARRSADYTPTPHAAKME